MVVQEDNACCSTVSILGLVDKGLRRPTPIVNFPDGQRVSILGLVDKGLRLHRKYYARLPYNAVSILGLVDKGLRQK